MAQGYAGLSMVCHSTPYQAAAMTCAGTTGCRGISAGPTEGLGGALLYTTEPGAGTVAVQPCQRIDAQFFSALLPAIVLGAVLIICSKKISRMFGNHS